MDSKMSYVVYMHVCVNKLMNKEKDFDCVPAAYEIGEKYLVWVSLRNVRERFKSNFNNMDGNNNKPL